MEINNLKEIMDLVLKSNTQRAKLAVTLANLAIHEDIPLTIKVAICTTMFEILKNDVHAEADSEMIKHFNSIIDKVAVEVKDVTGEDLREMMERLISKAQSFMKKREQRIKDGNNILNQINLN